MTQTHNTEHIIIYIILLVLSGLGLYRVNTMPITNTEKSIQTVLTVMAVTMCLALLFGTIAAMVY